VNQDTGDVYAEPRGGKNTLSRKQDKKSTVTEGGVTCKRLQLIWEKHAQICFDNVSNHQYHIETMSNIKH